MSCFGQNITQPAAVNDNRESCGVPVPSSCVPYVGYVSPAIEKLLGCKPNINDVLKVIQDFLDYLNNALGCNQNLTAGCLNFDPATVTQEQLNQLFINQLCPEGSTQAQSASDIGSQLLTIDIGCLQTPNCTPATQYTLLNVLNKLISGYCSLLNDVNNLKNILNI